MQQLGQLVVQQLEQLVELVEVFADITTDIASKTELFIKLAGGTELVQTKLVQTELVQTEFVWTKLI